MLKSVGFKVQVQLTVEKGRQFLPYSIGREIRLDRLKIIGTEILQIFKPGPNRRKCLGFHSNFSIYKRKTLTTFFKFLEDLVLLFVRSERFVSSNYIRIY